MLLAYQIRSYSLTFWFCSMFAALSIIPTDRHTDIVSELCTGWA
jgi:hypothetical protein